MSREEHGDTTMEIEMKTICTGRTHEHTKKKIQNQMQTVKNYFLNIGTGQKRIGTPRERIFMINTRKITETQKNNWIVGL